MCRDQDLISETDGRTDGRTYVRTDVRMKIEKPGVGRPPLGPAKIKSLDQGSNDIYYFLYFLSIENFVKLF